VSAGFVLTIASRGPSAIAELLVNFGCPIHISGMVEARALKFFFTKGDYIKSCQKDDKSPLKGAWFCSRDPFLYAQLWSSKKISTALGDLRSTVSWTTATEYHTSDGRRSSCDKLRHKLHRFDLSPCLLQTCLYNI